MKWSCATSPKITPYENNPRSMTRLCAVAAVDPGFGFRNRSSSDESFVIIVGTSLQGVAQARAKGGARARRQGPHRRADQSLTASPKPNQRLSPGTRPLIAELQGLQQGDSTGAARFLRRDLQALLDGSAGPDRSPRTSPSLLRRRSPTGDLWLLDQHRLLCGDAGVPKDLDACLTEPRSMWRTPTRL